MTRDEAAWHSLARMWYWLGRAMQIDEQVVHKFDERGALIVLHGKRVSHERRPLYVGC